MIPLKTKEEIKIMKKGGQKLAQVMEEIKEQVKAGVKISDLDKYGELAIIEKGGKPSFKMVPRYGFSTCLCVNDCVVHGIPTNYQLKDDDILGIDIGMYYQGFHTDMARTIKMPNAKCQMINDKIDHFLETGKLALAKAIKVARSGNHVGDISRAIQETIEGSGYSVVKQLVGHGVGKKLHEEPQIPGFIRGKINETPLLREGMTLAIEVIYNFGSEKIIYKNEDGWTIVTRDKSLSGLFENTIAITKSNPVILTTK